MKWILPLVMLAALGGCGLQPLYSNGERGAVGQALRSIELAPIDGKAGWLMRQALLDRLGTGGDARYRLVIELDDKISGFGVRADDAITRERRTLRARYQLIDTASGKSLLDASAGTDAGIDVVSSEYATVAAENSALERLSQTIADQIVARVAVFVQNGGAASPTTK
ncbi:MAG: LPS assembly lipoprotein LptE [Sphingomonadaceae bacterium]